MANAEPVFRNLEYTPRERAEDLVSRLTLEEKAGQMTSGCAAIERLGIPRFAWGVECIHGVARRGRATVFPQALNLGATFDEALVHRIATAISDEVRAKHNHLLSQGRHGRIGLVAWSPTVNLFRDPRWGRGQEGYGEDPHLLGLLGKAFVRGLQGDDPRYLKVGAAPKHFAAHSGPEAERHRFDARVSDKDLSETYLPHFEACLREAGAIGVMGAYNKLNGEHCCASPTLLEHVLRHEWGFKGVVLSDGGALDDLHGEHAMTRDAAESAAMALNHGCDLNLGRTYRALPEAVQRGLTSETKMDESLTRLFEYRVRLGNFDPPQMLPWSSIKPEVINCAEHRDLAKRAARESIVLLKNEGPLLPLAKDVGALAVVGPNAASVRALLGNYFGLSDRMVTPLEGITGAVDPGVHLFYKAGADVQSDRHSGIAHTVRRAGEADVIVAVMGIDAEIEGESLDPELSEHLGDRQDLALPAPQQELLEKLVETGKPVVLVLTCAGPLIINWARQHVPAILWMGYGGQEGGNGLADVLFGDHCPCGRLPVTWPKSVEQLPPFEDYAMNGRTYRFMTDQPLYPFGYGLSYTQFKYSNLAMSHDRLPAGEAIEVSATVTNTGSREGAEVVQVYLTDEQASCRVPIRQLVAVKKIRLEPGISRTVHFSIPPTAMTVVDDSGRRIMEPGTFIVTVGGHQGDEVSRRLTGCSVLTGAFKLIPNPPADDVRIM